MREAHVACLRVAAVVAALIGGLAVSGAATAGSKPTKVATAANSGYYNIGSLASEFLQSKTQLHILDKEDVVAPACHQHRFIKASVINQPTEANVGKGVMERKWVEHWTLERCGAPVAYWVYFTEVGKGGAYVSVLDAK
jgi:hypothetical protein